MAIIPGMQMPDLAIQIVNYRTKRFLEPLLVSITNDLAGSKLQVEINILDNASGDDLDDIAKRWKPHNVHTYRSDINGGFGAGHNVLAQKTQARYTLILNPDLLLIEANTIERLIDSLEQTRAAVMGPRLLTPRERRDTALEGLSLAQLKQQPWDHSRSYIGPYRVDNDLTEVAWVSGAVFLIKRQEFTKMGGFDEKFFLYYEEVDLCRRLRKQGRHILYDPRVQVLHYGSAVAKKGRHVMKSFLYFQRKRFKK